MFVAPSHAVSPAPRWALVRGSGCWLWEPGAAGQTALSSLSEDRGTQRRMPEKAQTDGNVPEIGGRVLVRRWQRATKARQWAVCRQPRAESKAAWPGSGY